MCKTQSTGSQGGAAPGFQEVVGVGLLVIISGDTACLMRLKQISSALLQVAHTHNTHIQAFMDMYIFLHSP